MAANLSGATQKVLVFSDEDHTMGLMVDEILDITDAHVEKELDGARPGVIGSAIVAGRATELVDPTFFLQQAFPAWFSTPHSTAIQPHGKRILAIDDSSFFLNLLKPLLGVAGYQVTAVSSGREGLSLCNDGATFDAIISDIEMPDMSGYEFAAALRHDPRFRETPVLALSSSADALQIARGLENGFDEFIAKGDREAILSALTRQFTSHVGGHA